MAYKNAEKKKEYQARYREEHREEIRRSSAIYNNIHKKEHSEYYLSLSEEKKKERNGRGRVFYANHIERERTRSKKYSEEHKEEKRLKNKKYNRENHAHKTFHNMEYRKAHPEQCRIDARNRRARVKNASGNGWIAKEEKQLFEDYCHRCAYCGGKTRLTVDHIVPLALGGSHSIDNAVPACLSCNSSKGARPLLIWMYRQSCVPQKRFVDV
jgi:5-methylcytosine-specific restriction endonuclease McrA